MEVNITNNVLNIATLQQKMETVVFDYIDSSQNWGIAYQKLSELFTQMVNYFNERVAHENGQLPKVNTYWSLFLNISSQLIYFTALAKQHAEQLTAETKQNIANAYMAAANILPNATTEEMEEYLDEVQKSYQALTGETLVVGTKKSDDCMAALQSFAKKWA